MAKEDLELEDARTATAIDKNLALEHRVIKLNKTDYLQFKSHQFYSSLL